MTCSRRPAGRCRGVRATRMSSIPSTIRFRSPTPRKKTHSTDREDRIMFGFVATKLDEFEKGKISRRRLIETLTLAATSAAATERASAAEKPAGLKVALVNHI